MRQPESLASASPAGASLSGGPASSRPRSPSTVSPRPVSPRPASPTSGTWLPSVPGILTADQILATGNSIAAVQQRDGAIGWPDGHVDAWNHVECAMALSVCGLRDSGRRA